MLSNLLYAASLATLLVGTFPPLALAGDCQPAAFPLGPVVKVNRTDDATAIYNADLAYNDSDDEFLFIWAGYNGNDNDVWGQRISIRRGYRGSTLEIANSAASQTDAAVVYNNIDNQYLISWRNQHGGPGSPGFNNAYGRIFNADGSPANGETPLYDAGLEASLEFSPLRNEYVLHARNFVGTGGNLGIKAIKIAANGNPLPPGTIIETQGAPAPAGQIIRNTITGTYLSTWRDQVASTLRGRMLNPDLSPAGSAFEISAIFPGSGRCASVAFDPVAEQFLVVFGQFNGGPVFGQFISGSGNLVGSEFIIHDTTNVVQPVITYNPTNQTFLVVWQNFNARTIDAQLLAPDGTRVGGRINVASGEVRSNPRVAADPVTGGFVVAWTGNHPDNGTGPIVMARLVDVRAGADWAAPYGVINLQDAKLFRSAFNAGMAVADLVPPYGVVDSADRAAYRSLYQRCR